jgi:septal ring-binding cell division protein DamX
MTMFIFIVELGFLVIAIIVSYKAQSTPFPWNIEPNT